MEITLHNIIEKSEKKNTCITLEILKKYIYLDFCRTSRPIIPEKFLSSTAIYIYIYTKSLLKKVILVINKALYGVDDYVILLYMILNFNCHVFLTVFILHLLFNASTKHIIIIIIIIIIITIIIIIIIIMNIIWHNISCSLKIIDSYMVNKTYSLKVGVLT